MKYDLSGGISRSAGRVFSAFRSALFALVQRQSFESITVQALCAEADYPRSTFYNYFDDIYDLLDFCLQTPILGFDSEKYRDIPADLRIHAVFSDLYDVVAPEDMSAPDYRGDKPTEFADSRSWDIPQNTPVYSFKKPQENMEVKHAPLEEAMKHVYEFKAKFPDPNKPQG